MDVRITKSFELRTWNQLGKYSDSNECIYALKQRVEGRNFYYIARDISFSNAKIEKHVEQILDAAGTNVDTMQHHDTETTWWELPVDSKDAAITMFMLVVGKLLAI